MNKKRILATDLDGALRQGVFCSIPHQVTEGVKSSNSPENPVGHPTRYLEHASHAALFVTKWSTE